MKKRIISMFLCLCMVFTMVGTMVPTASAAVTTPLTDAQITEKINKYIKEVEKWMRENSKEGKKIEKVYWNQEIGRSNKSNRELKSYVDAGNYTGGLSDKPCNGKSLADHHGENCNSNYFDGVHSTGYESQCAGFANYIEYVIFQDTGSAGSWETKYNVDTFHPGDLVRYGGHSAVVYKVNSSTVQFIECNFRGTNGHDGRENDWCIIRWDHAESINKIKDSLEYVVRPTATLRVGGTTPPPKPSAPTNVTGTWTSTGPKWQAKISWTPVSGATSYKVEYKTPKPGDTWKTDADYSSGTSYISTGLGNYEFYTYRVCAVNAGGVSKWTEYTLKKPGVVTPPAEPKKVSAIWTLSGKLSARVSWSAVNGAESYQVQYKPNGGSWSSSVTVKSQTFYTFSVPNTDVSYDFRVKAVNTGGSSNWVEYSLPAPPKIVSDLKEKEQPPLTVDAPAGVSAKWATTGNNASAELTWNKVSNVDYYEVGYKKDGGKWETVPLCINSLSTSYVINGLDSGSSYSFRIKAVKSDVSSAWAECTLAKSEPEIKLTAPSGVSGVWTSTGNKWQAKISWNPVSGATRYEVQYKTPKTGNAWKTDTDYSSGTSYISTGLGDYDSYTYRVRAVNANGASGWTEYTLVKPATAPEPTPQPTPTPPPSAPSGVSGVWTSTGNKWQAKISWNPVSGATRYEVQYKTPKTGNASRSFCRFVQFEDGIRIPSSGYADD